MFILYIGILPNWLIYFLLLNDQVTKNSATVSPATDFGVRVNRAIGNRLVRNVRFSITDKGNVRFNAEADANSVVAWVVEVDKK